MPISVSTDPVRPAERQAFWTEAICRSFANVETRPIGPAVVSGHFEFVEIGSVKLVRFDSSPQCYSRDARLVSKACSDEFMFDFQRRGRSSMVQAGNESTIEPGYGVLYDARRPFEDRLDGPGQRSEVLIVTVPAASLLRTLPACRAAMRKTRAAVGRGGALDRGIHLQIHRCIGRPDRAERHGHGCLSVGAPAACVRQRSSAHPVKPVWPGRHISEGEHRRDPAGPGDCGRLRRFGADFSQDVCVIARRRSSATSSSCASGYSATCWVNLPYRAVSIAALAMQCGFADAAHATRTFRSFFGVTPRDFRGGRRQAQNG